MLDPFPARPRAYPRRCGCHLIAAAATRTFLRRKTTAAGTGDAPYA
ncbi:hypothetical protein [Micromonospora cathayae]|uniref:Uncharacterized protein n=1 Tax=Micromonospora cathayae TaxID=3028804 RepID=A0ABY7ZKP0_9ACTN|nr:hypothetical protein [Micromonospora sp. HUAS 3]WDZ82529.1 hypothetical protein PVK37_18805 [Micromonospora sp. HUAS 3]